MSPQHESLERIDPELLRTGEVTGEETLELHLERYRFASSHITGGSVLDIACGVGYGTDLLASIPGVEQATGVDIDPGAIKKAEATCRSGNVTIVQANASEFTDTIRYDAIVSLETMEHLEEPDGFLNHLASLVKPSGLVIVSVPVTPSIDGNPHHRTDFSERTFRRLGRMAGLREIDSLTQVQHFGPLSVAIGNEARAARSGVDLLKWYGKHPDSLARRIWSTLRHGFVNIYRTQVWRLP